MIRLKSLFRWARIELVECLIGAPFVSRWAETKVAELLWRESARYHARTYDSAPLFISPAETEYSPCALSFRWDWRKFVQ